MALVLAAIAAVPASAHRRDEYLQAARIAIEPGRVLASLVLTPGIAIANGLLGEIDRCTVEATKRGANAEKLQKTLDSIRDSDLELEQHP